MNWRTIVGALFIVVAMVIGAFGGLVYAREAGSVGVSSGGSTPGVDVQAVSAVDLARQEQESKGIIAPGTLATETAPAEVKATTGDVVGKGVTPQEMRKVMLEVGQMTQFTTNGATITAKRVPDEGTRGAIGTRAGTIDAGGPYGGPDTFEGATIVFTVTTTDPTIIFFRWDFNNDGIFDFPNQTGGGDMGKWSMSTSVTWIMTDYYIGNVVVEGWDGVTTKILYKTFNNLGEPAVVNWYIFPANEGLLFRAKASMTVTQLGYYKWVYTYDSTFTLRLWTYPGKVQLGTCSAQTGGDPNTWYWCTLPAPVSLVTGQEYMLSAHKGQNYYPYWNGMNTPSDPTNIHLEGFYYHWGPGFSGGCLQCFPDLFGGGYLIPKLDFKYQVAYAVPDAASATATLEVNNIPPTVTMIQTSPDPILEGSPGQFIARFMDFGVNETWQVRWKFGDGTSSPWTAVQKYSGGANVLILHTWSDVPGLYTYQTDVYQKFKTACGYFCNRVDSFDFGPLGKNRVPSLDEIRPYNVILIGSNYYYNTAFANQLGDVLADFMDLGGGVVIATFSLSNAANSGIAGRFEADGYNPIVRAGNYYNTLGMGNIYVPGHPIMDGVSSLSAFYHNYITQTTSGATRIADWTNGVLLAATKENPSTGNGARAVALNWFPPASVSGDNWRMVANAVRWASRAAPPVLKPMPLDTTPVLKTFADDWPTSVTPKDKFPVTVEVKDSNDAPPGEVFLTDDMESGGANWVTEDLWHLTNYRSNSPTTSMAFNRESDHHYGDYVGDAHAGMLTTSFAMNPSGAAPLHLKFASWQETENGNSEGNYFDSRNVEISADNGVSWTTLPWTSPNTLGQSFEKWYTYDFDISAYSSSSQLKVRFAFDSVDGIFDNYEGWYVDDVRISVPDPPRIVNGLGSLDGSFWVANVPPTVVGGFDKAVRNEAQSLLFKGLQLSDPALMVPTEWFAYGVNFDDGTPVQWHYKGSLAPPKYKVLVVHTLCYSGNGCTDYTDIAKNLLSQDDVASVTPWNFFQSPPTAPSLATMQQYDVIIVAMNWAWNPLFMTSWDIVKRQLGDRLAAFVDSGRGGVITFFGPFDNYGGIDWWRISGRYVTYKYAPFDVSDGVGGGATLGQIVNPDHDVMVKVRSGQVSSNYVHSGPDMKTTVGGQGQAAGANGELLARWQDSNPAIGAKLLNNNINTIHVGAYGNIFGADAPMLLRNAVGLAGGGIPTPKIPEFTHTWGDNGIYNVDVMAIDDDMGYVWDFATSQPVVALPGQESISHRTIPIAVNNVDPTIDAKSVQAFIAAQFCVRVSGQEGNTVSLNVWTDGVLTSTVSTTRMSGDPNPPTEKCGIVKVDVTAKHTYDAKLTYSAPNGGSNPTWLIISPWREPVTPGHGTVTYKYDFAAPGTVDQPLSTLKADLLAGGQGAKIDFTAEASDPGTDDIAFMWQWGTAGGVPYDPNSVDSVTTIHVFHNDGAPRSDGTLSTPDMLGFTDPYFNRASNSERSPAGTMNFRVRDTAVHAFDSSQPFYYVVLMVFDDDNGRGYPSVQHWDGMDLAFILVDLR